MEIAPQAHHQAEGDHLDQPALQGHLLGIELAEPLPFDPQPANGDGQTGPQGHAGSEAQKGKGATQGVERGETGMTLRLGKAPPASLFHQREKAQAASSKSLMRHFGWAETAWAGPFPKENLQSRCLTSGIGRWSKSRC